MSKKVCELFIFLLIPALVISQELTPNFFIYVVSSNSTGPDQIYIQKSALDQKAVLLEENTDIYNIEIDPGYKYSIYINNESPNELDFYSYNVNLQRNPFQDNYELLSDFVISNYHDIDSYRLPEIDNHGNLLSFQKYNRDVGVICYIQNPLDPKNQSFSFLNPSNKNIRANAWGEIEKVSEREIDWYLKENKYQGVYILNRLLYFVPYPGAPENQHFALINEKADYVSPIWNADGTGIYFAKNNNIYSLDINEKAKSTEEILKNLNVELIYKLVSNPHYKNLIMYRYKDGDKVGIGIFNLKTQKIIELSRNSNTDEINPSWSPDGKRIAYIRRESRGDDISFQLCQYTLRSEKHNVLTPIEYVLDNSVYPVWLPDGSGILYLAAHKTNTKDYNLFLSSANVMASPFIIDLKIKNKKFNHLSDFVIYPKTLADLNSRKTVKIFLFMTAARSTKDEIYRFELGKYELNYNRNNSLYNRLRNSLIDVPKNKVNTYLYSIEDAKLVEKIRGEFTGQLSSYRAKIKSLEQEVTKTPQLGQLHVPDQTVLRFYREKFTQIIQDYDLKKERLLQTILDERTANMRIVKASFNDEENARRYKKIRKMEFTKSIYDVFSGLDRAIAKYQIVDEKNTEELFNLKTRTENELMQIVTDDKEYGRLMTAVYDNFEKAKQNYDQYYNRLDIFSNQAAKHQDLISDTKNKLTRTLGEMPPSKMTPKSTKIGELRQMNERYLNMPSEFQSIYFNFEEEVRIASRPATDDQSSFATGISGGLGFSEYTSFILAPTLLWQVNNNIFLIADINIMNQFGYKEVYTRKDSLDFSSDTASVPFYNFKEQMKYYEFGLGTGIKFDLMKKMKSFIGFGLNLRNSNLSIIDTGDSTFYSYHLKNDTTETAVNEFSKFSIYPYISLGLDYAITNKWSLGLNIRYLFPVAFDISGDNFSDYVHQHHYPSNSKEGLIRPDGEFIETKSQNNLYIAIRLLFKF